MSNQSLPGNPHYRLAGDNIRACHKIALDNEPMHQMDEFEAHQNEALIEATIALAFEQRTMNLIQYVDRVDDQTDIVARLAEITSRLGLDEVQS